MFSLFILVFLAALGSMLGWISLAEIMEFPNSLYSFGVIVILVLELIAALSVAFGKNKKQRGFL